MGASGGPWRWRRRVEGKVQANKRECGHGRWPGKQWIDPFKADFDMLQIQPVSRSVRLNGFSTCLRLEAVYWGILERIARANQCSVSAVLSYVDREVHLRQGGVRNFSGLIRVICVAWLLDPPSVR
ncbi:ribbon-helix-helix domain-containing protein [Pseudomonas putida]|uniref:Ribbon-helix-helix domain-containing protein n=2 Tax=Pseudomonas TaxID=286 RepID=A0A7W2L2A1_PSEPU|nr:ribbon-helix-helix domain-containing protein [Pseudomonas putida]MBI6944132.1 ribbon-helix-helix domain-containing protein [Pseudomonas putida]MBI6960215.1 ribbon-helix-helix domain-containing protein [Pseudomonas putida]PZQ37387.1 MAG: aryl-sulfate sulfotransferase [Pseudomonas putida]